MADPQDLPRLADEVEKATKPDRELDIAITLALGLVRNQYERATSHGKPLAYFWNRTDSHAPYVLPEAFTASLDAAMTLVPETWKTVRHYEGEHGLYYWTLGLRKPIYSAGAGGMMTPHIHGDAKTPALALCAAALKARAHSTKESDHG